jgi:hypothetical protein
MQRRVHEGVHVLGAMVGYALAGDLTGVKQMTEEVQELAQRFPGWVPVLHLARAEYQRLRGDPASALHEIEAALRLSEPGRHQAWAFIAAAHVRALFELGRHDQACALGEQYVQSAEREALGHTRAYVKMPLSLALASCGAHAQAAAMAESAIDDFSALGSTGLNLVIAYEARSRVAIRAGDQHALEQFAALLARNIPQGSSRTLLASHERVLKEARAAGLAPEEAPGAAADATVEAVSMMQLRSILDPCTTLVTCARAGLELLVRSTGSRGGLLYSLDRGALTLQAEVGELLPSAEIFALVRDYADGAIEDDVDTQQVLEPSAITNAASGTRSTWTQPSGELLRPMLLGHEEHGTPLITAVAVLLPAGPFRSPSVAISEVSRALQRVTQQERA